MRLEVHGLSLHSSHVCARGWRLYEVVLVDGLNQQHDRYSDHSLQRCIQKIGVCDKFRRVHTKHLDHHLWQQALANGLLF